MHSGLRQRCGPPWQQLELRVVGGGHHNSDTSWSVVAAARDAVDAHARQARWAQIQSRCPSLRGRSCLVLRSATLLPIAIICQLVPASAPARRGRGRRQCLRLHPAPWLGLGCSSTSVQAVASPRTPARMSRETQARRPGATHALPPTGDPANPLMRLCALLRIGGVRKNRRCTRSGRRAATPGTHRAFP